MATEPEYGDGLRQRIQPLMTGVGPVEAAAATAHALALHQAAGVPIDLLVSLGSAGSRRLEHAELYQVASIAYRDIDASIFGFEPGVTPLLGLPPVIPLPYRLPELPAASLSTGACAIGHERYDGIAADMVDMETYAVVRAAARFEVPVIGIRGISDGRDPVTGYEDWTRYLGDIDRKLSAVIDRLPALLADLSPAENHT
jgi:adenosylhomocysteine nucleosidase